MFRVSFYEPAASSSWLNSERKVSITFLTSDFWLETWRGKGVSSLNSEKRFYHPSYASKLKIFLFPVSGDIVTRIILEQSNRSLIDSAWEKKKKKIEM